MNTEKPLRPPPAANENARHRLGAGEQYELFNHLPDHVPVWPRDVFDRPVIEAREAAERERRRNELLPVEPLRYSPRPRPPGHKWPCEVWDEKILEGLDLALKWQKERGTYRPALPRTNAPPLTPQ